MTIASFFRRTIKGFFMLIRIDYFILPFAGIINRLISSARITRFTRRNKPSLYNDYYRFSVKYPERQKMHEVIATEVVKNEAINYLEFGVAKGTTFKWWLEYNKNPDSKFVGFDTFTGLPEDYGPYKKGSFSTNNQVPVVNDNRASFVTGLFQQTFLKFLKDFDNSKRLVLHLDADLYTATLYVLTMIYPYLKKDDLILFDEFNVPTHEHDAFMDFVNSFYVDYEVLVGVNNYFQLALKIK